MIKKIKNSYKKQKRMEVFYKIVEFFVLDICSKPIFCSKVAQKGKICSRLLEPQSCSKRQQLKSCRAQSEQAQSPGTHLGLQYMASAINSFYEPVVSGHGSRAPGSKSCDQSACGSRVFAWERVETLSEKDGNGRDNCLPHKNLHF